MNNPRNISSESAEIIVFQKKGRAGVPADMCLLRSGELISSFREASNHTDINGEMRPEDKGVRESCGGEDEGSVGLCDRGCAIDGVVGGCVGLV